MILQKFLRCGIILTGLLSILSISAFCQNLKLLDSLKRSLRSATPEKQFDLLNTIGFEYRYSYPDSTIFYCTRAYELGKKLKVTKTLARPLSFIGLAKANQGDYKTALGYQYRSVDVAIEQHDTIQLAHAYNNAGRVFYDEGDLIRAYTNFLKSKELFEKTHDKSGLAYVYRSLATLFRSKKDFTKALANSERALALRKELGDPRAITSAYMELGLVYEEMDSTPLALRQFVSADSIAVSVNDEITKAELKIGIGEILFIENRIGEAEQMAADVLKIVSANSNQKIFLRACMLSAKCKIEKKQNTEALLMLNRVYSQFRKIGQSRVSARCGKAAEPGIRKSKRASKSKGVP
ncbi:MAG: tetratricopeptide repeat protein [Bacteroidota bacterium]